MWFPEAKCKALLVPVRRIPLILEPIDTASDILKRYNFSLQNIKHFCSRYEHYAQLELKSQILRAEDEICSIAGSAPRPVIQ